VIVPWWGDGIEATRIDSAGMWRILAIERDGPPVKTGREADAWPSAARRAGRAGGR
jgi:hypothetical protein